MILKCYLDHRWLERVLYTGGNNILGTFLTVN
jgi:hypothetical protein